MPGGRNLKKDYGDNDAFIRLILWRFPPHVINFHSYRHHCSSNLPQVTTSRMRNDRKVLNFLCMHIWDSEITMRWQQFNRHAVHSSNREDCHKKNSIKLAHQKIWLYGMQQ